MSFELQGLDNLLLAFERLAALDPSQALAAAGDVLLPVAQQRVRVDTGELRDSLEIVVEKDGVSLQTDNDHAAANEFGTARLPAKSFMRATFDEDGDKAVDALGKALSVQIEQVGK